MEDLIGFVASNNKLSKILAVLDSKGPMDSTTIAKNTRIVGVNKNIEELLEKQLLEHADEKYALTEQGKLINRRLREIR